MGGRKRTSISLYYNVFSLYSLPIKNESKMASLESSFSLAYNVRKEIEKQILESLAKARARMDQLCVGNTFPS